MNYLIAAYNFVVTHRELIELGLVWLWKDWGSIGGLVGLKNFVLTGRTTKPEPPAQPKEEIK